MNHHQDKKMNRRNFLKLLGGGVAVVTAVSASGCHSRGQERGGVANTNEPTGKMTYRTNSSTGDKISILGFGCMRLPTVSDENLPHNDEKIDQEMFNRQVDYALQHGVNYFDTSPAYCGGLSERATGIALARHPRNSFFIATKLSNFMPDSWEREPSLKMYHNSFIELQVDTIDYMLLHGIGMGVEEMGLSGMDVFAKRYIDNGILDFLVDERKAGRIRNLGFSYHGDVEVFDYLLSQHDKYHWDFVQIQMNYVDWKHAKNINVLNTNAEYLYNELAKRDIAVVIMEPLLGGRLAQLPPFLANQLQQQRPNSSIASWAFRFAGSFPKVLTVLSGMTYMEHVVDNLKTFSPLEELSDDEFKLLAETANLLLEYPLVPCTGCKYCMPCPYGIDIPSIFTHYNKCVGENNFPDSQQDKNYREARRAFLIGYDRSVPKLRQANHCIACNQCVSHCPQEINIPKELQKIDQYIEKLKQGTL